MGGTRVGSTELVKPRRVTQHILQPVRCRPGQSLAGDELQIISAVADAGRQAVAGDDDRRGLGRRGCRSEEHTSELQSLMRISYAVFCLKKKNNPTKYKRKNSIRQKIKHE